MGHWVVMQVEFAMELPPALDVTPPHAMANSSGGQ
jgi:hypothetical protein